MRRVRSIAGFGASLSLAFVLAGCQSPHQSGLTTAGVSPLTAPGHTFPAHASPSHAANDLASLNAVVSRDPRDVEALNVRGSAMAKSGNYQAAISDFSAAIALQPRFSKAYYNRGLAYARIGDRRRAYADYSQAITIDPAYAQALVARAVLSREAGDLQEAQYDLDLALTMGADDPLAYYQRGLIHQVAGRQDEAIADFSDAIAFAPNQADIALSRAQSYLALSDTTLAYRDLEVATELAPGNPDGWAWLGFAAERLGKTGEARTAYRRALRIQPAHAMAKDAHQRLMQRRA